MHLGILLCGILVVAVQSVTVALNCGSCGTVATKVSTDFLQVRGRHEGSTRESPALGCAIQYLLNQLFLGESFGASKDVVERTIRCLQELQPRASWLDQGVYGAAQDGAPIRRHSQFVPDFQWKGMDIRGDKAHSRKRFRGSGPLDNRTALATRCPPTLRDALLDSIPVSRSTPQDGGEKAAFGARIP